MCVTDFSLSFIFLLFYCTAYTVRRFECTVQSVGLPFNFGENNLPLALSYIYIIKYALLILLNKFIS